MTRTSRALPAAVAALTGVLGGIGLGLPVADGRVWPIVAVALLALALGAWVRALVPAEDRAMVGPIVALAFALHVAAAVVLYTGSLAIGRGGFITGDDAEYAFLSRAFVAYLQGHPDPAAVPPFWGGEAYLFGTWVYLESAIFYVIGPDALVPILLNGALGVAIALVVFDMARRLFGRNASYVALVLVAFFPSLVIWSSLNLKDALTLLLIAVALWSLARFQAGPHWWPLALALMVLVPMESLRRYIFVGLALLIPFVVAVTPRLTVAPRARWTFASAAASGLLLFATQAGVGLGPQLLESFEGSRQAMAIGARTSFVTPPPLRVKEGDTFVVPPAQPTVAPTVVHVAANALIVVATPSPEGTATTTSAGSPAAPPTAKPTPVVATAPASTPVGSPVATPSVTPTSVVTVHAGDIVVVGPPLTTAAPQDQRRVISPTGTPVQLHPQQAPPLATPTAVPVKEGDTFVVGTPQPRIVHVAPSARVVVATGSPSVAPGVVVVRPGDVVVVGPPKTTPAPEPARQVLAATAAPVQLRSEQSPTDDIALRTASYLPIGLAFALFAPFPWQVRRAIDLATVPDMLLWYVALAAATVTLVRHRRRWREFFAIAGFAGGLLLLFSLVEGNVGTLYRHRAMAIPWVLLLAAPTLAQVLGKLARRARRAPARGSTPRP